MKLHCWAHGTVHPLTSGEVEQVVYALTAAYTDVDEETLSYKSATLVCPNEVLNWARDSEMYREHVEQGIECRKAAA